MTALPFAWRSLVRQPARSTLGVVGVAAVGALLFDMLLLSNGLVVSMRELFERLGFDIRIIATDQLPGGTPDITNASPLAATIGALPSVQSALTIRTEDSDFQLHGSSADDGSIVGVGMEAPPPWTILEGRESAGESRACPQSIRSADAERRTGFDSHGARQLRRRLGSATVDRVSCGRDRRASVRSPRGTDGRHDHGEPVRSVRYAAGRPGRFSRGDAPPGIRTQRQRRSPRSVPTCVYSPTIRRSASFSRAGSPISVRSPRC